ncbi:MAG: 4-hydroxy-tetrahydrodipicolinate reductase [Clostridiales bacterium GWF2_36_10]|nr:MAG: 4-hydroxy-tetrahydrodipicolinate reductase [Clostridiales bacterium GWF2_36_10]
MIKINVVGCTGKLGIMIIKTILNKKDVELIDAIGRKGNQYIGQDISVIIGGQNRGIIISDSILDAKECDVFIDCTNAENFIANNIEQYKKKKKPLVIATTGFDNNSLEQIKKLSVEMPVLQSGNFSIALHDFIETLKFAVKRISVDTDVQIIEFHHNQKKDAPSGTAKMIQDALIQNNMRLNYDNVKICSVRGGNIFGEHQVIFANCKDEVTEYKHQVSSREAFSNGAVDVAKWLSNQQNGAYNMDDFCGRYS